MAPISFKEVGKVYPDGTRAVDGLNLTVDDGDFMVLVGPSGCGKTTALRMVAGLEEISEGELLLGDQVINTLEPRKRDIAMVFQNYALYPHMTIFDNIAFPLRSRGIPRSRVNEDVKRVASMLGLESMLKRRPRTLSGGQRQRVAMGRALVRQPKVFLMDEPLSNLDAKLRVQMRAEISELQQRLGVTTLYVTHDQVEAMTMGNRVAVMRKGVLQQEGNPQDVYDHPANLFVATFIGSPAMNLFRATVAREGDGLACVVGGQRVPLPTRGTASPTATLKEYIDRDIALGIRPEHLADAAHLNGGTPKLVGQIRLVEALGAERLIHLEVEGEPVLTDEVLEVAQDTDTAVAQTLERDAKVGKVPTIARFAGSSRVQAGETAHVSVAVEHVHYFDLENGSSLG
jgi:multiple sugar transport system ATP-binding protein